MGFLEGAKLNALLARANIGVNPARGESLIACPNKLADYLAAGLPVLNYLPRELAELLNEYDAGLQFNADRHDTFVSTLDACVRQTKSLEALSCGARRVGATWFARKKNYSELAQFVVGAKPLIVND